MSYTMLMNPVRFPMLHLESGSVVLMAGDSAEGSLLKLPDEILLEIVQHIDRRTDLLNLCLTCRKLEKITTQMLYQRLDILTPQARWTSQHAIDAMPIFRPHVFQISRNLVFRVRLGEAGGAKNQRGRTVTGSMDEYVCGVLRQISSDRLTSFSLLIQNTFTSQMLNILANQQAKSLRELRFFEPQISHHPLIVPNNLRILHCRAIQSSGILTRLIEANKSTLESIHLGQEKELSDKYRRDRAGFLDGIGRLNGLAPLFSDFDCMPRLRDLSLAGVDLGTILPADISAATYLTKLESLTIESCASTANLLNALFSVFDQSQDPNNVLGTTGKPQLKRFAFRHESLTSTIKTALIRFLSSFAGLSQLTLLFENATFIERPAVLIAGHGTTLTHLVLETRIQPREHLGLDTSRPLGVGGYPHQLWQESVNDICTLCPNLVELGMAFPWDDEMVRTKKTKIHLLRNLKTIHVRNFPQSQVLSQLGDYAIQEYARKFVEWNFPSLIGSKRPTLETLVIGPTLYETRWKCGSTTGNSAASLNPCRRYISPPEYLRSHYFCLDWAKTRFERWHAMITPVSEAYMEEMRDEAPLGGIFAHVWLR